MKEISLIKAKLHCIIVWCYSLKPTLLLFLSLGSCRRVSRPFGYTYACFTHRRYLNRSIIRSFVLIYLSNFATALAHCNLSASPFHNHHSKSTTACPAEILHSKITPEQGVFLESELPAEAHNLTTICWTLTGISPYRVNLSPGIGLHNQGAHQAKWCAFSCSAEVAIARV